MNILLVDRPWDRTELRRCDGLRQGFAAPASNPTGMVEGDVVQQRIPFLGREDADLYLRQFLRRSQPHRSELIWQLRAFLSAEALPVCVYALLDGARDTRIEPLVRLSGLEHDCLFAGALSPRLRAAALYLVRLEPDSPFTREVIALGWGRAWGVFAVAPAHVTLQFQRRHWRTLLRVQDETKRFLMFRFYDPRVLRLYLPTCTGMETAHSFGPVQRLVMEAAQSGETLTATPAATGVRMVATPLPVDLTGLHKKQTR